MSLVLAYIAMCVSSAAVAVAALWLAFELMMAGMVWQPLVLICFGAYLASRVACARIDTRGK